jgi:hypothetical protein
VFYLFFILSLSDQPQTRSSIAASFHEKMNHIDNVAVRHENKASASHACVTAYEGKPSPTRHKNKTRHVYHKTIQDQTFRR